MLLECVCVFASIRVTIIMRHMRHILLALSISHANSFFQQQQHRTPPKQFTSSRESSSSRPSSLPTTPKAWVLSTFLAGSVLFGQPFLPMGGRPAAFADGTGAAWKFLTELPGAGDEACNRHNQSPRDLALAATVPLAPLPSL